MIALGTDLQAYRDAHWPAFRAKYPAHPFEYDEMLARMPKPVVGVEWTPEQHQVWDKCNAQLDAYFEKNFCYVGDCFNHTGLDCGCFKMPSTVELLQRENLDLQLKNIDLRVALGAHHTEQLSVEDEELPRFPQMSGTLHDLAVALFPDIPYSFKFMSLVTHWGLIRSGLDTLADEQHLQTRFYTCLISEPERGKTASIKEARKAMAWKPQAMVVTHSVDSGPSLVDEFGDLQKNWSKGINLRVLLDVDEMKDLFEKSKVTAQSRNSLSGEVLTLFEDTVTGNRARHANKGQRTQIENAHLAILGGATPEGYAQMWTGTGGKGGGLQSRFVPITTDTGPMPSIQAPSDQSAVDAAITKLMKLSEQPGQVISLSREARQVLDQWWESQKPWDRPSRTRVLGYVKRMLIVLAVTNGVTEVGLDLMKQATAFGSYVIAVREKFNPEDSYSWTQAFENSIIAVFKKYADKAFTMRDIRRLLSVERKPGGLQAFMQAWKNTIHAEVLQQAGLSHKGTAQYRLA